MALEEFQKQIKKEDRQKAWAKEHYKNKDHTHKETERQKRSDIFGIIILIKLKL